MISFEEFAESMQVAAARVPAEIEAVVERVAVSATIKAKSYIGVQQPEWMPLAESTMNEKARLGYGGPPDFNPLLREGNMRDSYEPLILGFTGGVVSDSKTAGYQEFGTSRIPPRPVTAKAVLESMPELEAELAAAGERILMGGE